VGPPIQENVKNAELWRQRTENLHLGAMDMSTGRSGTNGVADEDGTGRRCPSNVFYLQGYCILSWHGLENFVENLEVVKR
jgi:hypothetical protein